MKAENQFDSELCTEEALPGEETNMKLKNLILLLSHGISNYIICIIYSHYINDVCICGGAFPCVKCVCQAELMDKKIASAKILSISRDNADHRFGRRGEKNASVKGNACVGGWLRNVQNPIHRMIRKRKCIWGKCMSWIMNTASEMNTTSALTGSRYGLRSTIFVFA